MPPWIRLRLMQDLCQCPVHKCDHVGTVTVDGDAELVSTHTLGNAIGNSPQDSFAIPFVGVHILEGILRIGLRLAQITPQEGNRLCPGGFADGIEGGGRVSRSDPL